MRLGIVQAFVVIVIALFAASCRPIAPNTRELARTVVAAPLSGSVIGSQVDRLRVGMTMTEAQDVLSPAKPTPLSVPALLYEGPGGGIYYLVFYDRSLPISDQDAHVLQYVVFFTDTEMRNGVYVLPKARKGQTFETSSHSSH